MFQNSFIMKIIRKIQVRSAGAIFILLVFGGSVTAQHSVQKLENPFSAAYLKDNLRKESPRLVLNREIEENLQKKLKTDPVVRNVYEGIKRNAEAVFEQSIINLDIPMEQRSQNNQLDISRDLLHRVSMLAMVYRMEKDPTNAGTDQ